MRAVVAELLLRQRQHQKRRLVVALLSSLPASLQRRQLHHNHRRSPILLGGAGAANRQTTALPHHHQHVIVGGRRFKWLSGREALGNEIPIGALRTGHPDDPERNTPDKVYRGTASKGDVIRDDFVYREAPPPPAYLDRLIHKWVATLMWGWFLYHLYWHPGVMFGHYYIPATYEFSDEELGIPPDDAPDPEYWGNHGKKWGTYR